MTRQKLHARQGSARHGFTLVELLVVIGIIAVLISMLMPALAKARAQALSVKCESNLHEIGQSIFMFAMAHNGRIPDNQCGTWGPPPYWCNVMYNHDFFELEDEYGASKQIWGCPASASYDPGGSGNIGYDWGAWSEAQSRSASDALTGNTYLTGTGDPDNIDWPGWWMTGLGGSGGTESAGDFVDIASYSYMRWNAQYDPTITKPMNWWVQSLTSKTNTGNYAVDSNPPIMCDCTVDNQGVYEFNHGKTWVMPSISSTGLASAQKGDVRINVLFLDGHVENKAPDLQSYFIMGGPAYAFR